MVKNKYTISLLGCGKLGFPLAIELLNEDRRIKGSTTTKSKINELRKAGIDSYLINIFETISVNFFSSDILVITLPYKKSFLNPIEYKNQIDIVCENIKNSKIKHIVFTSSSSVYPKDNKLYSPKDKFFPTNLRSKILLECEYNLSKIKDVSTIIIRLGGIFGSGRIIKKSNKNRRLIHSDKAIKLIKENIDRVGENDIINGFDRIIY